MGRYFQQPLPPPEEPRKPRGRRRPRREKRTSPVIYILAAIGFVTVWVDTVGLLMVCEIASKRRLFHPIARIILALSVMMTTNGCPWARLSSATRRETNPSSAETSETAAFHEERSKKSSLMALYKVRTWILFTNDKNQVFHVPKSFFPRQYV